MQTCSSGTLIGWKSGQTTFVPLWDRMEGAGLWTLANILTIFDLENRRKAAKLLVTFGYFMSTTKALSLVG
jgi:hypothetical protein